MNWEKLEYKILQGSDIMESSNMKNMLVLKNLPSNMVEEAIIIFKENQGVKETEFIEKGRRTNSIEIQTKSKDCILKEAEMLITDYMNKIEEKKQTSKNHQNKIIFKYRILKLYSITSTIFLIISLILNFIQ